VVYEKYKLKQTIMENHEVKFASFGQRTLARIIDVLIIGIIAVVLGFMIGPNINVQTIPKQELIKAISQLFGIVLFWFIYQPIFETKGGTIGKKIVGLKTISLKTYKEPNLINSYGRSLIVPLIMLLPIISVFAAYFLSYEIIIIFSLIALILVTLDHLAPLRSPKKQTWHDKAANIAVIER